MKKFITSISILITLIGCGGSREGGDSETLTAYPNGFVLASPLANRTSSALTANSEIQTNSYDHTASFTAKKNVISTILNGKTDAACQVFLPPIIDVETSPSCYGPVLNFVNHLDGGDPAIPERFLPPFDLGIWTATEGGTQACTAAKLNALIGDASRRVDFGLIMAASMICTMRVKGVELPEVGASVDNTANLDAALKVNQPFITITSAKIERLADIGTNPVYKYTILSTVTSPTLTRTISTYIQHMPTNSDNSTYKGKVWSSTSKTNNSNAYSILYEKTATNLNYQMLSATYSGTVPDNAFDAKGNVSQSGNWNNYFTQAIFNLETTTGLGNVSYSWQAGMGDSHARVFNVFTKTSGDDTVGCGFYGYGPRYDKTATTLPNNSISRFICNWAGPGSNHTYSSGTAHLESKAQKQCMTQNTAGIFVATTNAIKYAPVNECSMTLNQTSGFNGGQIFRYRLATETDFPVNQPAVDNELILLTSDTDYANYTAPTAPTDF